MWSCILNLKEGDVICIKLRSETSEGVKEFKVYKSSRGYLTFGGGSLPLPDALINYHKLVVKIKKL